MIKDPNYAPTYEKWDKRPSKWHEGYFQHITKEGARYHVISWSNLGRKCSEPLCEVNAPKQ
jgi:hypothetical protein